MVVPLMAGVRLYIGLAAEQSDLRIFGYRIQGFG